MLSLPHVIIGSAAGLATGGPVGAFLGGIVSHHLMDMVPHYDVGTFYWKKKMPENWARRDIIIATVDFVLAMFALWWLWSQAVGFGNLSSLIFWGGLGGVFPDIWHHTPFWKKYTRKMSVSAGWYRFHNTFHATIPPKYAWFGIFTQLVFVLFGLFIISLFVPLL